MEIKCGGVIAYALSIVDGALTDVRTIPWVKLKSSEPWIKADRWVLE